MHEFDFIRDLLAPLTQAFPGAEHLTNDGAIVAVPSGDTLVVSTDTLVEGVHFFGWEAPDVLARKALGVNLSDLAALAARPLAYTLNLALPQKLSADTGWLTGFCDGLRAEQAAFGLALAGGDTAATPGPLVITITVFGTVRGVPLRRTGARPGQGIYVSGTLGDARMGLEQLRHTPKADGPSVMRYLLPTPRVELALALAPFMTAGLDVSDGLVGDLGHICRMSGVGARVDVDALPRSPAFLAAQGPLDWVLAGGDDYELLFTADPANETEIFAIAHRCNVSLTRIGDIDETPGLHWQNHRGEPISVTVSSYQHF